jgi:hypothetical protein
MWQTRTAAYCLGIDESAPLSIVVSLDDGSDLDLMQRRTGIRFCSRERVEGRRKAFGDEPETYLLSPANEKELWSLLGQEPLDRWVAVSPYPSTQLKEFAARAGIRCHTRDWEEFQRFGRKSGLRSCLKELDLPRLPSRMLRLGEVRYSELASEFGGRFVLQEDVGAAGFGTVIVGSPEDMDAANRRFEDSEVWAAPYAGQLSFNVNAIATGLGAVVGYPSVQIVGQAFLHGNPSGHGGNDFTATAATPPAMLANLREQSVRIGDWMAERGYRGLFGLDFVVDEANGTPCAVDLNPRWQGSTSLQAQAEIRQGRIPLAAAELAWQLDLMEAREILSLADVFFQPLEGSQVFPRNPPGKWWQARNAMEAGIYSGKIEYLRPALRLHELNAPDELVITGGVPRVSRPMVAGATLLRICGLRAAVDAATSRALPWVEEAVRRVYERLCLEEMGLTQ